ncbi:nucleoside deaminase [bacterium]|nr:MAG: nucleoside deaminase [bacterium]QQR61963.1 MAG: nucleoside deaminase [bacterium]QQR62444.1 MAG: nucleoside deaminase [bacterium]
MSFFGPENDIIFMKEAYKLALLACAQNEVPIGAIVVNASGNIIGQGFNKVEQKCTQAAHAECEAMCNAATYLDNWRLENCWLYVTVEPCLMCMGMIRLSRIAGVFYGVHSPVYGFSKYTTDIEDYRKKLIILSGVYQEEISVLMKNFFRSARGSDEHL